LERGSWHFKGVKNFLSHNVGVADVVVVVVVVVVVIVVVVGVVVAIEWYY
jgi:hypothetical protein